MTERLEQEILARQQAAAERIRTQIAQLKIVCCWRKYHAKVEESKKKEVLARHQEQLQSLRAEAAQGVIDNFVLRVVQTKKQQKKQVQAMQTICKVVKVFLMR